MIERIESDLHKNYVTAKETQTKDLKITVTCTLKEFYYGATKQVKYTKFEMSETSKLVADKAAKGHSIHVVKEI